MTKKFKDSIRQIHLWLGLGTGIIVFIISITGCLYVFEEEIGEIAQKDYLYVPVQQKSFAGITKIIGTFSQIAPGKKINSIRIFSSKPNATVVITSKKNIYYLNPYTAGLVKKTGPFWLDTVEEIHTSLLLDEPGKFIIRWSVVIFVLMLITGLVLWFPNQMRLLKQSLTIKRNASFKRLNYDLHNVLGFYASAILLVIATCGLYFAFKEVKTMASFVTGTKLSEGKKVAAVKPAVIDSTDVRYDKIYTTLATKYPGADLVTMSVRKGNELRVRMLYPYQWARIQNTFYYSGEDGHLLRYKLYKDFNGADLIEASNYDVHTGRFFGIFGKIVACTVSLISASLPVTGAIIWWKKRKKSKKKKKVIIA